MAAAKTLNFACTCGKVHGHLSDITPRTGAPITCHCDDCRRAGLWLGQDDTGAEGHTYLQTTPPASILTRAKTRSLFLHGKTSGCCVGMPHAATRPCLTRWIPQNGPSPVCMWRGLRPATPLVPSPHTGLCVSRMAGSNTRDCCVSCFVS